MERTGTHRAAGRAGGEGEALDQSLFCKVDGFDWQVLLARFAICLLRAWHFVVSAELGLATFTDND